MHILNIPANIWEIKKRKTYVKWPSWISFMDNAAKVNIYGCVRSYSNSVNFHKNGIRPAMWISLES